jgi:Na+-transporting NADH:ubiquinone oxidoreductase subunit F
MILDALERRLPSVIMLYWGVRHEEDIYWKNEFDMLAKNQLNFSWHLILSKPTSVWRGMTGHVTEHVLNDEKDLANNEFYLCGSRAMTEEVRSKLLDQNVPKEQIKSELFF